MGQCHGTSVANFCTRCPFNGLTSAGAHGMAIVFNLRRRPQLIAELARCLSDILVDHHLYVDSQSLPSFEAAEEIIRADELGQLEKVIGPRPLAVFVLDFVSEWLADHRTFEQDISERLADVPGIPAAGDLAEMIVQGLERLPWEYTVSFPLADQLNSELNDGGPWALGPSVEIAKGAAFQLPIEPTDSFAQDRFSLTLARITGDRLPLPQHAHVTFRVSGFLPRWSRQGPTVDAIDQTIRALFGLALVFEIFGAGFTTGSGKPVSLYIHRPGRVAGWLPHFRHSLSTSASRVLDGLRFIAADGTPHDWPDLTHTGGNRVASVMAHPDGDRLVRAARWYFDSYGADSVLMAYLQAMICLEILLGDGAEVKTRELSVGATLKNRCAYLIGRDLGEREDIIRTLGRIYKVRSDIVHTGQGGEGNEARGLLVKLRWYCARVIWIEADKLRTPAVLPSENEWKQPAMQRISARPPT
jgi:hypothetical protein